LVYNWIESNCIVFVHKREECTRVTVERIRFLNNNTVDTIDTKRVI